MRLIYSTNQTKARFLEVLRHVRRGNFVTISHRGEPVAEIRPIPKAPATIERRLDDLERRGVLVPSTEPMKPMAVLSERPGALNRFLTERGG